MDSNNLPAFAYIVSDPDFIESDVIESFPGNYNEEDPDSRDFFELCIEVCESEFFKAYKNLESFFDNREIKYLSIGCDVEGAIEKWASYLFDRSNSSKGEYFFFAGNQLIYRYLKKYWDPTTKIFSQYTWEHEIVHLLDHDKILGAKRCRNRQLRKIWIEYLLAYRYEGVADLYYFTKGKNPINDMESAMLTFWYELDSLKERDWVNAKKLDSVNKQIKSNLYVYTVGVWMVLHALLLSGEERIISLVLLVLSRLERREEVGEENILLLIKYGLDLTNDQFISSLMKSDQKGNSFLNKTDVDGLNRLLKI